MNRTPDHWALYRVNWFLLPYCKHKKCNFYCSVIYCISVCQYLSLLSSSLSSFGPILIRGGLVQKTGRKFTHSGEALILKLRFGANVFLSCFWFLLLGTGHFSVSPAKLRCCLIFQKMVQKESFRAWICVTFQRSCSDGTSQPIHHPVNFTAAASKRAFTLIFTTTNTKRDSKNRCTCMSNDRKPN